MEGKQVRHYTSDPYVSLITPEDVLLVWDGSIGKCASGLEGAIGSTMVALTPKGNIPTKFIEYLIKHLNQYIKETSTGTGLQHINKNFFKECIVPVPPLPEQKRLVAKLDATLARVNNCKTRLDKIPTLLRNFRQSVLAAAVSGELTNKWREKNSNIEAVSLANLSKERQRLQKEFAVKRGQKSFKYKEPVEIEIGGRTKGVDELFELPEGWQWVSLDKVVWNVSDGPHFSPKYVSKDEGIAFISGRNISYSFIDFGDAKYVSKEDHLQFIKRGKPEVGDLLLTKGGTTGIAHVVNTRTEFSIWVHVALLKVITKFISAEYLRDVLTSDFLYRQSQAQTHGVGNQDLGLTRLIFMTVPLPPVEEQKEIVRKVEELFHFANSIEARYQKAKMWFNKIPQAILAKAFFGELVAQNENDEPASVLLDRIKKEKQNSKKPKPTAKRKKIYEENDRMSLAAEE